MVMWYDHRVYNNPIKFVKIKNQPSSYFKATILYSVLDTVIWMNGCVNMHNKTYACQNRKVELMYIPNECKHNITLFKNQKCEIYIKTR